MRIGSKLIHTATAAARGTARVVTGAGSHAVWWVNYRLHGTARQRPPDAGRKKDH